MGDHCVLLVNRLVTDSTLEASIVEEDRIGQAASSTCTNTAGVDISPERMDIKVLSDPMKLVQCRICHDEDGDFNMEIPCACRGSLKYAHRKCVQRWCIEKGDTICEICRQQFGPNYTAPPPLFHRVPLSFRGHWEISRRDILNTQFVATVARDNEYLDSDLEDYADSSRGLICCRVVAIIFMLLLVLRHTLPFLISGAAGEYSMTLFTLLVLRTIGILLPMYIMVRAFSAIQRRRRRVQQVSHYSPDSTDEEHEIPHMQPQSQFIHVQ